LLGVLILLGALVSKNIAAQEVQVIRPLSFGTVAVLDNDSVGSIAIDYLGNTRISTNFAVIELPEAGIFRLVGYPANSTLFVTGSIIQAQTSSPQVSPEQFELVSVDTPISVNIENDGTAEFGVGGELVTSGSTNETFGNQEYTARLLITVNF